jgi:hypothetical protein
VLIKEITRRVNLSNRWQAVYTAGVVLPKPVSKCRYNHRTLNPKKLVEVFYFFIIIIIIIKQKNKKNLYLLCELFIFY